jgi:dTDP-4-dehydrorhamnose reductase
VPRRVAITGAGGQLGRELVRAFAALDVEVLPLARPDFDITRRTDLERLAAQQLDVVVNAAAWTDVDACALDPERAQLINGTCAGWVAAAADRAGALAVQVSTNEVFDGQLQRPYTEVDMPRPINPYGASKLYGETAVTGAARRHLIVRTAWLYGGPQSFPAKIRAAAERARHTGQPLRVVADELGNPTPAAALAERIVNVSRLAEEGSAMGIIHLAGQPPASRYEWARRIVGPDVPMEPIHQQDYPRQSRPPLRAILSTDLASRLGLPAIEWLDSPG